jgi:hypothetical protein
MARLRAVCLSTCERCPTTKVGRTVPIFGRPVLSSRRLPMPLEVFFTSSTRGCRGAARPGRCLRPQRTSSSGPVAAVGLATCTRTPRVRGQRPRDASLASTAGREPPQRRRSWAGPHNGSRPIRRRTASPREQASGGSAAPRSAFQPGRRGPTEAGGMAASCQGGLTAFGAIRGCASSCQRGARSTGPSR